MNNKNLCYLAILIVFIISQKGIYPAAHQEAPVGSTEAKAKAARNQVEEGVALLLALQGGSQNKAPNKWAPALASVISGPSSFRFTTLPINQTPKLIDLIRDHYHHRLVPELLSKPADVNVIDENGNTPLIEATKFGRRELIPLLLKAGARIDAVNKNGDSALITAIKNRNKDIVKLLLDAGANLDNIDIDSILKDRTRYYQGAALPLGFFGHSTDIEENNMLAEIVKMVEDEKIKRPLLVKKRKEDLVKLINESNKLLPEIAREIADLAVHDYSDVPPTERTL